MDTMHKLKEMITSELEILTMKKDLTISDLEVAHKGVCLLNDIQTFMMSEGVAETYGYEDAYYITKGQGDEPYPGKHVKPGHEKYIVHELSELADGMDDMDDKEKLMDAMAVLRRHM